MTTSKLPRHPHAEKPRPDEKIIRQGGADLQNGWLGRHGTLSLTRTRLVFVPTVLDTLMRARRREILLDNLQVLQRQPRDVYGGNVGGKRDRMVLVDHECAYEFMVNDLDNWIDMIEMVVAPDREGRGLAPMPVERDNYENPLLQGGAAR